MPTEVSLMEMPGSAGCSASGRFWNNITGR